MSFSLLGWDILLIPVEKGRRKKGSVEAGKRTAQRGLEEEERTKVVGARIVRKEGRLKDVYKMGL